MVSNILTYSWSLNYYKVYNKMKHDFVTEVCWRKKIYDRVGRLHTRIDSSAAASYL